MDLRIEEDGRLVADKKTMQAILQFASADPSRPRINQLRIAGNRIVATDGHSLVVVTIESEHEIEDYGIDSNWLKKELRSSTMKLVSLVNGPANQVLLNRLDPKTKDVVATMRSEKCNETFPPVFDALPEKLDFEHQVGAGLYFDPSLFLRLDKLVSAIDARGVRMQRPHRPLNPVRFDLGKGGVVIEGALMPMRKTTNDDEIAGAT